MVCSYFLNFIKVGITQTMVTKVIFTYRLTLRMH